MMGGAAHWAGVTIGQGGSESCGFISCGGSGPLVGHFREGQFGLCCGDGDGSELFEIGLAFCPALFELLAFREDICLSGLCTGEFAERGKGTDDVLLFGVSRGEFAGWIVGFGLFESGLEAGDFLLGGFELGLEGVEVLSEGARLGFELGFPR
jgi:hypothetical protein